jgi:hypothetical protein
MTMNHRHLVERLKICAIGITCLVALGFAAACSSGGGEQDAEPDEAPAAEEHSMEDMAEMEDMETSGAPRIWFITPEDGATVTSPVAFEFGHENIMIEPKGEVHAGAGHHHIGLNTECLPPGAPIPEADPWVHFGDGSAMIEMQLPPGEHTLTIQLGDGEHVALDEPGLCQSITITVEEGA